MGSIGQFGNWLRQFVTECVQDVMFPRAVRPRRREGFRFARYLPLGWVTGLTDVTSMGLVLLVFGLDAGMGANITGALVAYTTAFVVHRNITFTMRGTPVGYQVLKFALYKSVNLAARIGGYILIIDYRQYWGAPLILLFIVAWNFFWARWAIPGETPVHFYRVMARKGSSLD